MKKTILKALALLSMMALLLGVALPGSAELATSIHPIVDPKPAAEYTETEDEFFNLLLLGIDYISDTIGGWGGKKSLDQCHTDAIMLVAMNLTKNTVSLVSIPRDTFVYVPGVHGMYKVNAAVNCAGTYEEGLLTTCRTVSWLLGGVKIDRYCALDVTAMIALGDAMGGVDFELDMNYNGDTRAKKAYTKGMQHLDGLGIMDYLRVRTHATVGPNDQSRTRRQRAMMKAIYLKLKDNMNLINDLYAMAMNGGLNFFTNLEPAEYIKMLPVFMNLDIDDVKDYMLEGTYGPSGISDYYFNRIDQDARKAMIKTVFGIDAEELPFVSKKDITWLDTDGRGLKVARRMLLAKQLILTAQGMELNDSQKALLTTLENDYNACVAAFDEDAVKQTEKTYTALGSAYRRMQNDGDKLTKALKMANLPWNHGGKWYRDTVVFDSPAINWN